MLAPPSSSENENHTLVDALLAEQRNLTAVDRFARWHDRHEGGELTYRRLLPSAAPRAGQQYAFEVDLDKCSGCKGCVTACHALNGLDENETWRGVGLLVSVPRNSSRPVRQQHVTTACHHCADPGCLNGCPVLAYDKDPVTGIVRHLDDQCIGCQYCVMKCPYEVPKYSPARGIVRKCDMCANRLEAGEAPACVQACPNEAIRIVLVETKTVTEQYRQEQPAHFLTGAPDPAITLPTTRYVSQHPSAPDLLAADHAHIAPADAHLPLVFMLVLTQLAVGMSVAAAGLPAVRWLPIGAVAVGATALGIASLHLGKPLKAWRAFLGWRRSWFSREVMVFGGYVPLAAGLAAADMWPQLIPWRQPLAWAAAGTGLLGVFCSAMIYADTRRAFWSAPQALGKFLGTTAVLGLAALLLKGAPATIGLVTGLLMLAATLKLAFEHRIYRHWVDEETPGPTPLNKTARLLVEKLAGPARFRIFCGIGGGIALPGGLLLSEQGQTWAWLPLALVLVGELLERYLFFTAVASVKMPGGVAA